MKLRYGAISNIYPLYAALGNPPSNVAPPEWKPPSGLCAGPCPRLRGIDELVNSTWKGEKLGYLHLDVEGGELAVLKGAATTLHRDRPFFTVERHVHTDTNLTHELMRYIETLVTSQFCVRFF